MKADKIKPENWQAVEQAFITDMLARELDAKRGSEIDDMILHTDVWLSKLDKVYSVDVKNFSLKNYVGFYFTESKSQWSNTQRDKIRDKKGVVISGEYIIIPTVKDNAMVWAVLNRTTLASQIHALFPFTEGVKGNPNYGRTSNFVTDVWWHSTKNGETRYSFHASLETFDKLVVKYIPRQTPIRQPSGAII